MSEIKPPRLVLASSSATRRALLCTAGIKAVVDPARIDETALKARLRAAGASAHGLAETLAEAKAVQVSQRRKGALVLGADQTLGFGDRLLDKPVSMAEARAQLQLLRGGAHQLFSAACVVRDGAVLWRHVATVRLVMRDFSAEFLEDYLAHEGTAILSSVGGYRLEGRGVQLFKRIEGDYFAILGLALLPLLDFLRQHGVVNT
jgi:septum formation protein